MKNPLKFIQDVKQEAFRVTWPTGKQTLQGAIMVFFNGTSYVNIFSFIRSSSKIFFRFIT